MIQPVLPILASCVIWQTPQDLWVSNSGQVPTPQAVITTSAAINETDQSSHRFASTDARDYASWARLTYGGNPPACYGHTASRNLIVGGVDDSGNYLQEFWTVSGSYENFAWRPSKEMGPPPHRNAAMATSTTMSVLFGGRYESNILNTTWLYQDNAWSQLKTDGPTPEGRFQHAMIDTIQGTFLYGGLGGLTLELAEDRDDTWLFNGTDWIELDSVHSPGARHGHQLARNQVNNQVILHGGYRKVNERIITLDDTWIWNGNDWTLIDQGSGPGGSGFGLGFSTKLDGFIAVRNGNAWLLRGNSWSDLEIKPTIPSGTHPGFGAKYLSGVNDIEAIGGIDQPWRWFMLRTDRLFAEDCNEDGIDDATQLANGTLADCNLDGIPDVCTKQLQDCNENDVLDDCETAPAYRQSERELFRSWGFGDDFQFPFSIWMKRYQVTPETQTIDRMWFYFEAFTSDPLANIRVGIWRDEKGTGMPGDATLVYSTTSKPAGKIDGWQRITFPPITMGPPGTAFFVGLEYQRNAALQYPGSAAKCPRINAEDQWWGLSRAPFNFDNLDEASSQIPLLLIPWGSTNSGNAPLTDGFMLRVGVEVPEDQDGNFIPDVCDVSCIGNLNGDEFVDSTDLGFVLVAWNDQCPDTCPEDINGDGFVDAQDLGLLLVNWGACPDDDTP